MIGRIAKGCKEDLLVFDSEAFTDNADFSGKSEFASADDFYDQPAVANGATKLLGEEIGMNVLPGNLPIEIEAIFELYE